MCAEMDIRFFKSKASMFPEPVRSLILSEGDRMDSDEFIVKYGVWERILKLSGGH
jgi:hypothetical protein